MLLPDRSGDKPAVFGATRGRGDARTFAFDACLGGNLSQADVFDIAGLQELIEAALDGYAVTVFAFGQTGSGKTHTILGPTIGRLRDATVQAEAGGGIAAQGGGATTGGAATDDNGDSGGDSADGQAARETKNHYSSQQRQDVKDRDAGLLSRCLVHAFRSVAARAAAGRHETAVHASCCEIYNENVTDLLGADKARHLAVRHQYPDSFYVEDLTTVPCTSAVQVRRAPFCFCPFDTFRHLAVRHQHPDSFYVEDLTNVPCRYQRALGKRRTDPVYETTWGSLFM